MGLSRTVDPTAYAVTLNELKEYARIDHVDEDRLHDDLIIAGTEIVENITGRQITTATWAWTLDGFPCEFQVPKPKLQSVTSIQYVDTAGDTQTLATSEYTVITDDVIGRIDPAYSKTWPATRSIRNAVTVTFVAGYGAASAVPEVVKRAIGLAAIDLSENRSMADSGTKRVRSILSAELVVEFV